MGIFYDKTGVNVPEPGAMSSNLSTALQHPVVKSSRNFTVRAVCAGRRVNTNANRFLLRFGELSKSSATQYEETSHEDHIFPFSGRGL